MEHFFAEPQRKGYQSFVPDRMEQASYSYLPEKIADERVFVFWFDDEFRPEYLGFYLTNQILAPHLCPQLNEGYSEWQSSFAEQRYVEEIVRLADTAYWLVDPSQTSLDFVPMSPDAVENLLSRFDKCDF